MTSCDWWNIKQNTKNGTGDLYSSKIQIFCSIFCVSLYMPSITSCYVFIFFYFKLWTILKGNLNKYMTRCDWWNIKCNTKNASEDLYLSRIYIFCITFLYNSVKPSQDRMGLYNPVRFVKFVKLHLWVHFIDFFNV